jgi:Periplasmic copper-binding protein (NosD)
MARRPGGRWRRKWWPSEQHRAEAKAIFTDVCDFMRAARALCPCSFISSFQGSSAMTKTAFLLALIVTAVASIPAQAQQVRGFVSGEGLDTNPCTVTQPCRTFQQAFNTIPPNGVIWVLDPAGYGPLTITHGVYIQGRGIGAITTVDSNSDAIIIRVTTGDPVILNGLLLDGAGTGNAGVNIESGPSVQILNSVVRHFSNVGILTQTQSNSANLLIEDTTLSDNAFSGVLLVGTVKATLNRVTANNNQFGVGMNATGDIMIANSVFSNNSGSGVGTAAGVTWLAKNVISGNPIGVEVLGGTVNSYGDNYIRNNVTPVQGALTPVTTQ